MAVGADVGATAGEAEAAGLAADEGVGAAAAEGLGAEASVGAVEVGEVYLASKAGHEVGHTVAKVLGTHEKTTEDVMGVAGGAAAGAYIGSTILPGPGTIIGGIIGGAIGFASDASVICSELHRQGQITDSQLRWIRKFRMEHVSTSTYLGYLAWACPIVRQMRKEGWFNKAIRPVALVLIHQWINIAQVKRGGLAQRAVYRVAYCASRTVWHLREKRRVEKWLATCKANKEVCHG